MSIEKKVEKWKVNGSFAGRKFVLEIEAESEQQCKEMFGKLLVIESINKMNNLVIGANTNQIMAAIKNSFKKHLN